MLLPDSQATVLFDVEKYLSERPTWRQATVIEFGHGGVPTFVNTPELYRTDNHFIGVEANLRDPLGTKVKRVQDILSQFEGYNIRFLDQKTGAVPEYEHDSSLTSEYCTGTYDCKTELADEIANEVIASNVVTDPHVGFSEHKLAALLGEFVRVAKPTGSIVLRETITPDYTPYLKPKLFEQLKLQVVKQVNYNPANEILWGQLEEDYGQPDCRLTVRAGSKYYFLQTLQ